MTTLADIRTALVDAIQAAMPTVQVYRLPPDTISVPAVILSGFTADPTDMSGGCMSTMDVSVAVSRRHVDQIDVLDAAVDPGASDSVWAAIAADPSLGGICSCVVSGMGDYRELVLNDVGYYAATLRLEVWH
jgi:hypothetical protein